MQCVVRDNQFRIIFLICFILFQSFLFCTYICALYRFYNIIYPFSIIIDEHVNSLHVSTIDIYWKTAYSILQVVANHRTTAVSFICLVLTWYLTEILLPCIYYLNTILTHKCYKIYWLNCYLMFITYRILHKLSYRV